MANDDATTTISAKRYQLDMMDHAADVLFETDRVRRHEVLEELLMTHPETNKQILADISPEADDDEPSGDENDSNIILDGYDNGAD